MPSLFPPSSCTIWPTTGCNLACGYCYVYKLYRLEKTKMDIDMADEAFSFLSRIFRPDMGSVWFFGGEPLMNFEVVKYIVEKILANGYRWRFGATTNATLITEDVARWMGRVGFALNISIDGVEETHDRFRRFPDGRGSWEQVWRGIKLVVKYVTPKPELRWTVFPDPEILEKTPDAYAWMIRQGLHNIAMDFVYEVKMDEDLLKEIRKFMERIRDILDKCYENGLRPFSMMVRDAYQNHVQRSIGVRVDWMHRCGLGQGDFAMDPWGNLYPCHRFVSSGTLKIGNVRRGFTPERLYLNEKWWKMPPYSQEPSLCLECRYRWACTGGCLAMNYDMFGDIHVVPRSLCLIKDLNMEVFEPFVRKWGHVLGEQYGGCQQLGQHPQGYYRDL